MLLELQNLGKSFGEHEVLRDVNAGVERGDRIGIIGANGTGKTTLLRILCGESLPGRRRCRVRHRRDYRLP